MLRSTACLIELKTLYSLKYSSSFKLKKKTIKKVSFINIAKNKFNLSNNTPVAGYTYNLVFYKTFDQLCIDS